MVKEYYRLNALEREPHVYCKPSHYYYSIKLFSLLIISLLLTWLWLRTLSWNLKPKQRNNELSLLESKSLILGDHENGEHNVLWQSVTTITQLSPFAANTNELCNFYNCFNVYGCGHLNDNIEERISVYIYPSVNFVDTNDTPILSAVSQQFRQLLVAIIDSEYYTPNANNACLFIPNIDLLNEHYVKSEQTSQILASLQYWNNGTNHLIFNMISGSFPNYNTRLDVNIGNAIIAGGGFDSWTYRNTFDVSIPVYSLYSDHYDEIYGNKHSLNHQNERKWFITGQYDSINAISKQTLTELEYEHNNHIIVLTNYCSFLNQINETEQIFCNKYRNIEVKYPQILGESTFCLIIRTTFLGHPMLSDSLMSGCIPVIISDNYVLPFEEKIDWKLVSIRVWERSLSDVFNILKSVSTKKIQEMRKQTVLIWKTYFSSMKSIALTTLKIINDRLFPNSNKPDYTSSLSVNEYALISPKSSSWQAIGFTAIILTYDRLETLFEVIKSVVRAPSCIKIVVIWNNQIKKPPQQNQWPNIHVPLHVIVTNENKLSNRFYPYEAIDTDAILAIDDDIVMLTADELEFGFQVWKEFPDRIVGFPSRVHRWDNRTSKWKYESEWTNDISMILTGAAFYHKYYNHLYTNIMPKEIKSWVDRQMNCEDIAMNFLVSNVTGKSPIKVTPRKKYKCPECTNTEMLSADVVQHLNERSDCISRFTSVYRTMPLKAVEFRADPVLFRDNLPEKLKKYSLIGSL